MRSIKHKYVFRCCTSLSAVQTHLQNPIHSLINQKSSGNSYSDQIRNRTGKIVEDKRALLSVTDFTMFRNPSNNANPQNWVKVKINQNIRPKWLPVCTISHPKLLNC